MFAVVQVPAAAVAASAASAEVQTLIEQFVPSPRFANV